MSRTVCKNCGSTVEQGPYGRWLHAGTREPRCLVYAEPFAPFGTPIEFPGDAVDTARELGGGSS